MEFFVGVAREGERRETILAHDDAEFFLEFADQRVLGPLTGFDLAAGKLPQAFHRLAGRAAGEQHPPVGIDQRAGGDQHEPHLRHAGQLR